MDPNASGQGVLSAAAYAGRGFGEVSAAFGLEERYGDGLSLYEYLGSNGWGRFDAGGMFISIGSPSGTPVDAVLDTVSNGALVGAAGYAIVNHYVVNLDMDADWASDWSQADNWYSRDPSFNAIFSADEEYMREMDDAGTTDVSSPPAAAPNLDIAGMGGKPSRLPFVTNPSIATKVSTAAKHLRRAHGLIQHIREMRKVTVELIKRHGISRNLIRHHQELVDATGRVFSKLKPDVQAVDVSRKIIYIREVTYHGASAGWKAARYQADLVAAGLDKAGWIIDFVEIVI
jgi:hypothetical protein